MTKILLQTFRLMLAIFLACRIAAAMAVEAPPLLSNYVYELKAGNGQLTYVFGSAHVSVSRAPNHLGQCVKDLIAASKVVYIESDQLAIRIAMAAGLKTVRMERVVEFIDKDTLDALRVARFGSDPQAETKLKALDANALMAGLTSRIPGREQILGFADYGPDTEVAMAARYLNIPVAYVERPEDQWFFFGTVPPIDYARAIVGAFKLMNDRQAAQGYHRSALKLLQAAAVGDEAALLESMQADEFSGFYRSTISARNPSLAAKIDTAVSATAASPVFVALGALHLAGEDGVVQRLGRRGYAVSRLCQ